MIVQFILGPADFEMNIIGCTTWCTVWVGLDILGLVMMSREIDQTRFYIHLCCDDDVQ
jgi:hypothetical protein